ncbi:hypothetical protein BsWGS_24630 [Bradybaena similaris]
MCFPHTGKCEPRCDYWKHGPNCSLNCGRGCINSKCDDQTGKCSCKPGFWNDSFCDTECDNPTAVCEYIPCSEHCLNNSCNYSTGHCDACAAGYEEPDCEAIEIACSQHCRNESCNQTSGECLACAAGYEGSNCTLVQKVHCGTGNEGPGCEIAGKDSSTSYTTHVWMAVLILLLLCTSIFALWFITSKKRHVSAAQEGNKDTQDRKGSHSSASPVASLVPSRASIEEHGSDVDYNPADYEDY